MNYQQTLLISKNKDKLITQLKNLRRAYMVEIYKGAINNLSVREIQSRLWKLTLLYQKRGLPTDKRLYNEVKKLVKPTTAQDESGALLFFGRKPTQEELTTYRSEKISSYWNKIQASSVLDSTIYDLGKKQEAKDKEKAIDDMAKAAKKEKKVFYLCSEHLDSADDHKHHQGKLYIDRYWRQIVDREDIDKVAGIVAQRKLKTFQSIIGKPVWMVTRPNCRHFFETLSLKEVDGASAETLLIEKDMRLVEGNRPTMQTYRVPTRKDWQTRANAQDMVAKYKDRLATHQDMYNIQKNDFLRLAIKKDKLLISKWKKRVMELS